MAIYKLKFNDGSTNNILCDEDFAKASVEGKGTYELIKESGPTQDDINLEARIWRDQELGATDSIAQTPDFPNRDKYLTYRQALRDWPSTADFPDKKPTLGS